MKSEERRRETIVLSAKSAKHTASGSVKYVRQAKACGTYSKLKFEIRAPASEIHAASKSLKYVLSQARHIRQAKACGTYSKLKFELHARACEIHTASGSLSCMLAG